MGKKKSEKQLRKEYEASVEMVCQKACIGLRVSLMALGRMHAAAVRERAGKVPGEAMEASVEVVRAYAVAECGAEVVS